MNPSSNPIESSLRILPAIPLNHLYESFYPGADNQVTYQLISPPSEYDLDTERKVVSNVKSNPRDTTGMLYISLDSGALGEKNRF